ncbi:hypothetical protein AB9R81_02135 [Vibrio cyclitrophicus]|uniref:hypothetical protein n=1 Tax=Vibrio cyclitrophicus TaxID=47951 RepID=UPI000C82E75E|nr:hypothetical protein [Vibrio cyclitrophicus]PMI09160.1 hypothetical protein BCU52_12445 [Vibrio cyclitrophicus]
MTVVVSWTRKTQTGRELWVMSDSRLSGGKCWDYGPKVFSMGRSDAVIAFAGDTAWAYPLISQVTSYVESFVNLRERAVDFVDAQKKIIRMLNDSLNFVSDAVDESLEEPDCTFIFSGYSARKQEFMINKIVFNSKNKEFETRPPKRVNGELLTIIGDERPKKAIYRILSEKEKNYQGRGFKLDMEPSEAFVKVLLSGKYREIGGSPQIMKLYQNMNQQHVAVYWPPNALHEEQKIYLRGRELGKYEALDNPWVFSPYESRLYWHDFSPVEMQAKAKADKQPELGIVPYLS